MKYKKLGVLLFLIMNFSFCYSQTVSEIYDLAKEAFEKNQLDETYRRICLLKNRLDELPNNKQDHVAFMEIKSAVQLYVLSKDTMISHRYGKHTPLHLFQICVNLDAKQKLMPGKGFENEIRLLYPYLYENAKVSIQEQLVNYSELYLEACKKSDEKNDLNLELEAGVLLLKTDSISAKSLINRTITQLLFTENLNSLKALIGLYIIQSRLYAFDNDALRAYNTILDAYKVLDQFVKLSQNSDNEYSRKTKNTLQCMELESLANIPDRKEEAIRKYEEAIKQEPLNYSLYIGYGQVLAHSDIEKAAEIYNRAIEIEPKNYIAYYNMGAMYFNEGYKFYEKTISQPDTVKYREAFFAYQEFYGQAYIQMENAYKIRPDNLSILYALRRLAAGLYYSDEAGKWDMLIEKIEYKRKMGKE